VIRVADDHMVEHFDFEELTHPDEVSGHFDVCFGWLWFTTGVIVHEYDGCGCGDYGGAEHLSGMHQDGIERANRKQLMPFDAAAGVEQ